MRNIDLTHENRVTAMRYFALVEQMKAIEDELSTLKPKVIAAIKDNGEDAEGAAKTDRMEATVQYKGEAHHLQYSITYAQGAIDYAKAFAVQADVVKALGGAPIDPELFRKKAPKPSEKLVWVEHEEAKKAAKKAAKNK